MITMVTKKELEDEIDAWKGVNSYLHDEALKKLRFGQYDKPKEVIDFDFYKAKTMKELRAIARSKGIRYYGLKEDMLINKIMR